MYDAADAAANATVLCKLAVEKAHKSNLAETRQAVERKTVMTLKEYKTLQASVRPPTVLLVARSSNAKYYQKSKKTKRCIWIGHLEKKWIGECVPFVMDFSARM